VPSGGRALHVLPLLYLTGAVGAVALAVTWLELKTDDNDDDDEEEEEARGEEEEEECQQQEEEGAIAKGGGVAGV